jgi:hypothetical protein
MHPIAKVYLALTLAFYWIRLRNLKKRELLLMFKLLVTLCIPLMLYIFLPKILPILKLPPSEIMGDINFSEGISYNLPSALNKITGSFIVHNILWTLLLVGSFLLGIKKTFAYPLNYLFFGMIVALIMSLVFILPGYPAELFDRLWVVMFMIGALMGGKFLYTSKNKFTIYYKIIFTFFLIIISGAWWSIKYVPEVMNGRSETLIESIFKENISTIPLNSTILYVETNFTLETALLLGAEKYGALAYPMLKESDDLVRLLYERKPNILMAPADINLNSLSKSGAKKFMRRQQGLNFEYVKEFKIQRQNGSPLNKVYLYFSDVKSKKIKLTWEASARDGKILKFGEQIIQGESTKLEVPINTETLHVKVPEISFWLKGISGRDNSKLTWPWNEGWRLGYNLRYKNKPEILIDFTPTALLQKNDASDLTKYVDKTSPVIQDKGGIIFLRTIFN